MTLKFYKYEGTGNDFIIADNRDQLFDKTNTNFIRKICDRKTGIGADGLILLEDHEYLNFKMIYYNSDGSQSGFCGNGSRCITHFARFLDIIEKEAKFEAYDGIHKSKIINDYVSVSINDIDSSKIKFFNNKYKAAFIDSGSPHLILNEFNIDGKDIVKQSRIIKNYFTEFEDGININYFSKVDDKIILRTYERGVEDETLSCGTGAVALALFLKINSINIKNEALISTKGGDLSVYIEKSDSFFNNIWLSGNVRQVFYGNYNMN